MLKNVVPRGKKVKNLGRYLGCLRRRKSCEHDGQEHGVNCSKLRNLRFTEQVVGELLRIFFRQVAGHLCLKPCEHVWKKRYVPEGPAKQGIVTVLARSALTNSTLGLRLNEDQRTTLRIGFGQRSKS